MGYSGNILFPTRMLFHKPPVTPSGLGPDILLSIPLSNTLNVCSSNNMTDQILHPYKMHKSNFECYPEGTEVFLFVITSRAH